MMATVGVVAIGRNEGKRLQRCLTSVLGQADRVVYVDSGSIDGSVRFAASLGITVVRLDASTPFTAARARNAGFAALQERGLPDLVQFVDGDCSVDDGWIAAARSFLEQTPDVGLVTGWRTELYPDASIYNAMAEVEWHRPAGEIAACGGDMMVRNAVFQQVGGFNPRLICSEDEDFVIRVRKAGQRAWRLPLIMTRHDLAMTRFSQWWRRTARTGHGFAEVGAMHPPHFRRELQRVWVYGGALPVVVAVAVLTGTYWLVLLVLVAYGINVWRSEWRLIRQGVPLNSARRQAVFLTLSKLANMQGLILFHWRRWRGRAMTLIEYK